MSISGTRLYAYVKLTINNWQKHLNAEITFND